MPRVLGVVASSDRLWLVLEAVDQKRSVPWGVRVLGVEPGGDHDCPSGPLCTTTTLRAGRLILVQRLMKCLGILSTGAPACRHAWGELWVTR